MEWWMEQIENIVFKDLLKKLLKPLTDLLWRYREPVYGYFREHLDLTLLLVLDRFSGYIEQSDYNSAAILVVLVLYFILVQPKAERTVKPLTIQSNLESGNEHHSAGGRSTSQQKSGQANKTTDLEPVFSSVPRSMENIYGDVPALASNAMRDLLILHAGEARNEAYKYADHVRNELEKDLNLKIQVEVSDEIGLGKGELSFMDNIFNTYRYIFVLMTKHSIDDVLFKRLTEMGLIDSIDDEKNNFRVIPLWWTHQSRTERQKYPLAIRTIRGIEYADIFKPSLKASYIRTIKELILRGRECH